MSSHNVSAKAVESARQSQSPGIERLKRVMANFSERHGGADQTVPAVACYRDRIALAVVNVDYAYGEGGIDLTRRPDKGVSVSAGCAASKRQFGVLKEEFDIPASELPALVSYVEGLAREWAKLPGHENGLMTQIAMLKRWAS